MKFLDFIYDFFPVGRVVGSRIILITFFAFFQSIEINGQINNYSTHVEVVDGKKTTTISYVIQINNKESNWLADINIPVDGNQKFEFIKAEILDFNGKIKRKLKKKEIESYSDVGSGTFFEDDLYHKFSLNWNVYPYIISYSYRIIEDEFLFVARWSPSIYENVNVREASLVVELPSNYNVRIDTTMGFNFFIPFS